jgi:hypothetical protein
METNPALDAAKSWVQEHLESAADGSKDSRWLTIAELHEMAKSQIEDLDKDVLEQALRETLGRGPQRVRRAEDGTPHTPVAGYCVFVIEAAK